MEDDPLYTPKTVIELSLTFERNFHCHQQHPFLRKIFPLSLIFMLLWFSNGIFSY